MDLDDPPVGWHGLAVRAGWHGRFTPGKGRIHFRLIAEDCKARIAYIGLAEAVKMPWRDNSRCLRASLTTPSVSSPESICCLTTRRFAGGGTCRFQDSPPLSYRLVRVVRVLIFSHGPVCIAFALAATPRKPSRQIAYDTRWLTRVASGLCPQRRRRPRTGTGHARSQRGHKMVAATGSVGVPGSPVLGRATSRRACRSSHRVREGHSP